MTLKHKTLVGLFLALMSGIGSVVAATIPGTVDDIDMVLTQDSGIAVSWSAAADAATYRIYFSRQSILDSQGDYDDYVETVGTETTYVFPTYPVSGTKMFAAVLAVSSDGTESEGFVSETSIDLPEIMESSSSSSEASSEAFSEPTEEPMIPTTTTEPLTILSVTAESSTGILVSFSKPIQTDLTQNPFMLTETGGAVLRIISAQVLSDQTIRLNTAPQKLMQKYLFSLVGNITALDGTSMTVSAPKILFDAFLPGSVYVKNPALTNVPKPPFTGPTNVRTVSKSDAGKGTFTVDVSWTMVPFATKYIIYSSVDNAPFTRVGEAKPDQTSAVLRKVTSPHIAVKVTAVSQKGEESQGFVSSVPLPTGTSSPLPNSGLPLLGVLLAAGGLAGSRMKWRKK